jgi:hypothetical protein
LVNESIISVEVNFVLISEFQSEIETAWPSNNNMLTIFISVHDHFIMPTLLSLPPEILLRITILLSRGDLRTFSLLSWAARQHAIPSLFSNVRLGPNIQAACDELNSVGNDIKDVIK